MSKPFSISILVQPEMLQHPPPQFAHRRLLYTPLCISVGGFAFPTDFWCDFAGPLLLRWHHEVERLIAHESRFARLVFCDTPNEVWLRRTKGPWWKASCVTWQGRAKMVVAEALCLPEHVEAELHAATRGLLDAARNAGVWTEDAAALDDFLNSEIVASGPSS